MGGLTILSCTGVSYYPALHYSQVEAHYCVGGPNHINSKCVFDQQVITASSYPGEVCTRIKHVHVCKPTILPESHTHTYACTHTRTHRICCWCELPPGTHMPGPSRNRQTDRHTHTHTNTHRSKLSSPVCQHACQDTHTVAQTITYTRPQVSLTHITSCFLSTSIISTCLLTVLNLYNMFTGAGCKSSIFLYNLKQTNQQETTELPQYTSLNSQLSLWHNLLQSCYLFLRLPWSASDNTHNPSKKRMK